MSSTGHTSLRFSVGARLSIWARIAAWWTDPRDLVTLCAECHCPVAGDSENRRRAEAEQRMRFDECHGPGPNGCLILEVSWS